MQQTIHDIIYNISTMSATLHDEIWLSSSDTDDDDNGEETLSPLSALTTLLNKPKPKPPPHPLDLAITHILRAVAHLHHCGSTIQTRSSEAFWIFCAGSIKDETTFEGLVKEAGKKLERRQKGRKEGSVEEDLKCARMEIRAAEAELRKGEMFGDLKDLEETVKGCGIW